MPYIMARFKKGSAKGQEVLEGRYAYRRALLSSNNETLGRKEEKVERVL